MFLDDITESLLAIHCFWPWEIKKSIGEHMGTRLQHFHSLILHITIPGKLAGFSCAGQFPNQKVEPIIQCAFFANTLLKLFWFLLSLQKVRYKMPTTTGFRIQMLGCLSVVCETAESAILRNT